VEDIESTLQDPVIAVGPTSLADQVDPGLQARAAVADDRLEPGEAGEGLGPTRAIAMRDRPAFEPGEALAFPTDGGRSNPPA
jgi:hypothetical protein